MSILKAIKGVFGRKAKADTGFQGPTLKPEINVGGRNHPRDVRGHKRHDVALQVGKNLRELRQKADVSTGDLAVSSAVGQHTIVHCERGRWIPTREEAERLSRALNCSPYDIVPTELSVEAWGG